MSCNKNVIPSAADVILSPFVAALLRVNSTRDLLFAMLIIAVPSMASAQMPGAPVLQNSWASPGIVVALDFASGMGSLYGGAVGWAPSSGRFQLSAGAGSH